MYVTIGEIVENIPIVSRTTYCEEIYKMFSENVTLDGVIICENEIPIGLVMKTKFFQKLSTKFGFDLFMKRTVSLVMDIDFLLIESSVSVTDVTNLAMGRSPDCLYDFVIVTKNDRYLGVVSIRDLLLKLSEIQINIARYSSPLTGLPGNYVIEEELNTFINRSQFSVFYFDINSFKFFNDTFGFKLGDELIKETARIITNVFLPTSPDNPSFVGHIGGDDFIASLTHYHFEGVCQTILQQFDTYVEQFYSNEELKKGYITGENRNGIVEKIPLVSLSIAVIQNKNIKFSSVEELSKIAAKVKKKCKSFGKSVYLSNEEIIVE
jgi:diguanylate cyclase (GGDEF)-like protein